MAATLHQISVPIFVRHLKGLAVCLKKAQAHYADKKYDETTLLHYRLFPDMFNFIRQVQVSTDHAKTCTALLAGVEAPKFDDSEKSLGDLIARVEKTIEFLNAVKPEQINGQEGKSVTIKMRDRELNFTGIDLLQNRSLPNFYFHCTTAYNILRHQGVEIGKGNFMGNG
jgi:hypothetical protein